MNRWISTCAVGATVSLFGAAAAQAAPVGSLSLLGTYATGLFDEAAAEIVSYDPATQQLFVVNAQSKSLDVLSITDPTTPTLVQSIDMTAFAGSPGGPANSVSVKNGIIAVAVEGAQKTDLGKVAFFNATGTFINAVNVGALPDMVTFSQDGTKLIVANEGEPDYAAGIDPMGTVSIIDLTPGIASLTDASVQHVTFSDFNVGGSRETELPDDVRVFGPKVLGPGSFDATNYGTASRPIWIPNTFADVDQDLEPEYIATVGNKAYVALQEANAIAMIDITTGHVDAIMALGFKDHSLAGNGIDASDRDNAINIRTYDNVLGMYHPDTIAAYEVGGKTFLITANEGDSRDYFDDGFYTEQSRVKDLAHSSNQAVNTANFPGLLGDEFLGRLNVTTANGYRTDVNGNPVLIGGKPVYDTLYAFGARSFSIWEVVPDAQFGFALDQAFDSGDQFEQMIAALFPDSFNVSNTNNSFDNRSDDKGPEPEVVALGQVGGRTIAWIGMERFGGIFAFDVTDPYNPVYLDLVVNRDFTQDLDINGASNPLAGDSGPEGMFFIPGHQSPTGQPLLVVSNESSGTTSIYSVNTVPEPATALLGAAGLALLATRRRRNA